MSLSHSNHGPINWIKRIACGAVLAIFIFALQLGIPWVSNCAADKMLQLFSEAGPDSWVEFASSRLRMYQFFHPKLQTIENVQCVSSAICGDKLTALLAIPKSRAKDSPEAFQLLRCDLRSGSINVSVAPSGVRYLLSDGNTVWQLPAYSERIIPFVWEGKPAAVARWSRNRSLRCLVVFADGRWVNVRPCGISRSLLREILVLGDGLLFVSWVPGAIAALTSQHGQRLGDLMSDTIVVRETLMIKGDWTSYVL